MTTDPTAIRSTSTNAGGDQGERSISVTPCSPISLRQSWSVYRELAPPPDLAPYVACVWTTVHRGGVIFPDGCVDLVWHGTHLVVAGPATGPVNPSIEIGDVVGGVRF